MSIPSQAQDHSHAAEPGQDYEWPADDSRQEASPRSFERVPPHNLEAEQSVLGGMLLSKDAIEDVAVDVKLKGRDFYRPAHEVVFRAVLDLSAKGEPADPIMVTAELTRRGELAKVGGAPYLHTLVESVPSAANAGYYAAIVKDVAVLRRLTEAGARITQMGFAGGDVSETVNAAGNELFQVADENADEDYSLSGSSIHADLAAIEADDEPGLATGLVDLDSLTSGFKPGEFVIVAGRPAMGKSTLALDFVRANAHRHGRPVALFSLEMSKREINYRIMSAEARVPLHHIRNKMMVDDDWTRLSKVMPALEAAPLWVDASPNLMLMDIRTKARRLVQRHGVQLVVIDYIQLMQAGGGKPENRQQEVSDISRGLKLLAKELHVPVIGLSQLNRGPEQRTDKKPAASDLRESGSLEQDADMVILLHREDAYEKESPRAGEADVIVAKHRNGPTATITVAFQGHYSRFIDMARDDQQVPEGNY